MTQADGTLLDGLEQGPSPIYRRLYGRLREAIISGDMPAGHRLPSSRVLAVQLGIARNTVLLAYEQLLSEGYLEARPGSGHYVAHLMPDRIGRAVDAAKPEQAPRDEAAAPAIRDFGFVHPQFRRAIPAVPFRANIPAMDAKPMQTWIRMHVKVLRHAGRSAARPGYLGEADAIGERRLRQAIAEHVGMARGVRCSPDQVIVTAGAQHAMDLLMRVLARPGEEAWIEDPCFLGALAALQGAELRPVPVAVDGEGLDVAAARARAPRASLAIVCPSKQYPLGHVMSLQRRLALIDWARQHDAWIIEDDYDSEYRFSGRPIPSLQGLDGGERVIYVGTFSKVLFPALRIGFIVAPGALVEPLVAVRALSGRHGNAIDQEVLARFIMEGHLGRHTRRMHRIYKARMEALLHHMGRHLSGFIAVEPAGAGLQTIGWLADGIDDEAVYAAASRGGIEVANLSRYCIRTPRPPAIVLGYGAFSEDEIAGAVVAFARIVDEAGDTLRASQASARSGSTGMYHGHRIRSAQDTA